MTSIVGSYLWPILLLIVLWGVKPPEKVLDAFDKKFPDASDLKWDKEGDHAYMASFFWNDTLRKAKFSDKGKWLETLTTIEYDQLPEKVTASFEKNYDVDKIKSIMKSESSLGKFKYIIEIKKLLKSEELTFLESGKEMSR